jgi:dethiobiotin synthetase
MLLTVGKDIKEYMLTQARDHGIRFPGWKLVEAGAKQYTDEEAVTKPCWLLVSMPTRSHRAFCWASRR